jgi:hypothetical protein
MFDQQFVDQLASMAADVVAARLNRPKVEQRYLRVEEAAIYAAFTAEFHVRRIETVGLPGKARLLWLPWLR